MRLESLYPEHDDGNVRIFAPQKKVHGSVTPSGHTADYILFSAGVGIGKSQCALNSLIKICQENKKTTAIYVLPYAEYWDDFMSDLVPLHDKFEESEWAIEFTNGSEIICIGVDDNIEDEESLSWPEIHSRLRDIPDWDVLVIDEASALTTLSASDTVSLDEKYNLIWCELLSHRKHNKYPVLVLQTPDGHNYWWGLFVQGAQKLDHGKWNEYEKQLNDAVYYTVQSSTLLNTNLPEDYVPNMLLELGELLVCRMIDGDWITDDEFAALHKDDDLDALNNEYEED